MKGETLFKQLIVKKLTETFDNKVDYKIVDLLFSLVEKNRLNYKRQAPYVFYLEESLLTQLTTSQEGLILNHWLVNNTEGIDKPKNKGRKIVRMLDTIKTKYPDVLPSILNRRINLLLSLELFLLHEQTINALIENMETSEGVMFVKERVFDTVILIERYITCLVFIDGLKSQDIGVMGNLLDSYLFKQDDPIDVTLEEALDYYR